MRGAMQELQREGTEKGVMDHIAKITCPKSTTKGGSFLLRIPIYGNSGDEDGTSAGQVNSRNLGMSPVYESQKSIKLRHD